MIVLDTSVLVDALTGPRRSAPAMRQAIENGDRFLVPALAGRSSFARTATVSGVIWAAWHYPAILLFDYRGEAPLWYGLLWVTVDRRRELRSRLAAAEIRKRMARRRDAWRPQHRHPLPPPSRE